MVRFTERCAFDVRSNSLAISIVWFVLLWPFIIKALYLPWQVEVVGSIVISVFLLITLYDGLIKYLFELSPAIHALILLSVWILFQPFYLDVSFVWTSLVACTLLSTICLYVSLPVIDSHINYKKHLPIILYTIELFIIANLFFSFFLGVGEHYSYRSGNVRAFGSLGDAISPVVGFFVIKNALDYKWIRGFLAAFALAITGGKVALGITIIAILGLLIVHIRLWKAVMLALLFVIISFIMLHLSFMMKLPPNRHLNPERFTADKSSPMVVKFSSKIKDFLNVVESESFDSLDVSRLNASSEEVQVDTMQSGTRRLMSIVAGLKMVKQHPIGGVGWGQSRFKIPEIAEQDPLGLGMRFSDSRVAWSKVHGVQNASIRILAETGAVGLILFWVFCFGLLRVFLKFLYQTNRTGANYNNSTGISMSVWSISFIISNQTVAWMAHAHLQLIWLSFCAGNVLYELQNGKEK